MYYRNGQGRRRRIEATADTKTAAQREAVKAFERAMAAAGGIIAAGLGAFGAPRGNLTANPLINSQRLGQAS